jgi:hypothetical protein
MLAGPLLSTPMFSLQQIQRPNFDRHGAWLTAGNMEIHLIKGIPLVHRGENLIVSHIALDVKDPEEAFRRLRKVQVPFEVNVSVPKGGGKAECEGGGRDNTFSQAFIRDPDGYYLEVCNCNILTEFALGKAGSMAVEDIQVEESPATVTDDVNKEKQKPASLFCKAKLLVLAHRAKKRYKQRKILSAWNEGNVRLVRDTGMESTTKTLKESKHAEVDSVILENLEKRLQVYGDICQSFEVFELEEILLEADNNAPKAILLMLQEIQNVRVTSLPKWRHHGAEVACASSHSDPLWGVVRTGGCRLLSEVVSKTPPLEEGRLVGGESGSLMGMAGSSSKPFRRMSSKKSSCNNIFHSDDGFTSPVANGNSSQHECMSDIAEIEGPPVATNNKDDAL